MNMHPNIHVDEKDIALLAEIEEGLPLEERPFAVVGQGLQMSEEEVLDRLSRMQDAGIIKRFGFVLQHRPLGYRANAMVVWDIPDQDVDAFAALITQHDFVTLCYCRTRQEPRWSFNLYCMIHGRERSVVEEQILFLKKSAGLEQFESRTLFSQRRFKQTGARFSCAPAKVGA